MARGPVKKGTALDRYRKVAPRNFLEQVLFLDVKRTLRSLPKDQFRRPHGSPKVPRRRLLVALQEAIDKKRAKAKRNPRKKSLKRKIDEIQPVFVVTKKARRKPRVVTRHVVSRLDNKKVELLAFLTTITPDCDDAGRLILDFECLERTWWEKTWNEHLAPNGGAAVAELFGDQSFSKVFFNAAIAERTLIHDLHRLFLERILDDKEPGPVSLVQMVVRRNEWADKHLAEVQWYALTLGKRERYVDRNSYEEVKDGEAVYEELAMDFRYDPLPVWRQTEAFDRLSRNADNVLKAVHLPQWQPEEPEEDEDDELPDDNGELPDGEDSPGSQSEPESPSGWLLRTATRLGATAVKAAEELAAALFLPPGGPPLVPALAGVAQGMGRRSGAAKRQPLGPAPAPETHAPMQYHGRPLAAPLGAQVANPMLPGASQPFVGVCNIGQGNLNPLYGGNGRIIAYYDFGFPKTQEKRSAPELQYAPCLHDDPPIILSHWDWDHYSMARRQRESWDMRWIAPQQHIGSPATREIYGRVLASATGEMRIWPGAAAGAAVPEHLRLPWGFLERGVIHDQLGDSSEDLNDGGLAMYVCVKTAGVGAAGATGVANAALLPRGGAAPLCRQGAVAATAARAAAAALHFEAKVAAVAEMAAGAVAQFPGAGAPLAGHYAEPAAVAVSALAGGGTWIAAMNAMTAAAAGGGGGPGAVAATFLGAAPAGASAAAAATANAAAVQALVPGTTAAMLSAVAAIADAAEAVAGLAAGPFAAPATAAATAAVQAVQDAVAGAAVVAGAAFGAVPAAALAVTDVHLDAQLAAVAAVGAAAAAEAAVALAAVPATAANDVARAAMVAVGVCAMAGADWDQALTAMATAGAIGGGAVMAAASAGALQAAYTGAGTATMEAAVAAAPGAIPAAAGPPAAEDLAAAAAIVDAAGAAAVSAAAVRVAAVGGADARAGAAAGGAAMASILMARAQGQDLQDREVLAAAREAAREVAEALNGAAATPMQSVPAPLPAIGNMDPLGVGVGPTQPAISAAGLGGATSLALSIQAGAAPTHANERFIVLTGDVAFHCIPTQAAAARPPVVAITPSHHGANTCFLHNGAASLDFVAHLPWAPGTAAAAGGAAAHAVRLLAGPPGANVQRVAAAACYCAAEVAIAAAHEPVTRSIALADVAAAANAGTAAGTWDQVLAAVAAAGTAGFALTAASAALAPLAGPATAAAAIAGAAASSRGAIAAVIVAKRLDQLFQPMGPWGGAAMNAATASAVGAAAAGITLAAAMTAAANAAMVPAAVPAALQPPAVAAVTGPVLAGEIEEAVVTVAAAAALADAEDDISNHAGDSHTAATAARAAALAVANDAAAATGVALAAVPAAAVRILWPGPGAGFGPADYTNVPSAAVEAAVEAFAAGFLAEATLCGAAATLAAVLPRADRLAYSYGVRNDPANYKHFFGAAGNRHPSPEAVMRYEARGWNERLNTSHNSWRSQQPDPWTNGGGIGPTAGAFVAGDNVALGWENVVGYEGPLRGDGGAGRQLNRSCAVCGNLHYVC
ncbi:MAG TPA: hypothetical protein VGF69_05285 [Thermoanaerobaculia bacterium]|jgi:hypothetical protein